MRLHPLPSTQSLATVRINLRMQYEPAHLAQRCRAMRESNFIAVIVLALVTFLAPVPERSVIALALQASSGKPLVIIGNSVIQQVSKCDADSRNLATMISDATGLAAANASIGGQGQTQADQLAEMAIYRPEIRVVVLPLSATAESPVSQSLQTQLFFDLANGSLSLGMLARRVYKRALIGLSASPAQERFSYQGVEYPDYSGIKKTYFATEKQKMGCPENAGHDRRFIEAYHWASFSRDTIDAAKLREVARLTRLASSLGKQLIIVLMPINIDNSQHWSPIVYSAMTTRRDDLKRLVREAGVDAIDLTMAVPPSGFSDRWCACGHLGETGRKIVAERIAQALH